MQVPVLALGASAGATLAFIGVGGGHRRLEWRMQVLSNTWRDSSSPGRPRVRASDVLLKVSESIESFDNLALQAFS